MARPNKRSPKQGQADGIAREISICASWQNLSRRCVSQLFSARAPSLFLRGTEDTAPSSVHDGVQYAAHSSHFKTAATSEAEHFGDLARLCRVCQCGSGSKKMLSG